jgi:hypothetical protein
MESAVRGICLTGMGKSDLHLEFSGVGKSCLRDILGETQGIQACPDRRRLAQILDLKWKLSAGFP